MPTQRLGTGENVYFAESGSGTPLLQLHGVGLGHWNVSKVSARLDDDFTCLDMDMLGYGESDPPSRSGGIIDLADSVADFIKSYGQGPLNLHGTSFGGIIAIVVAGKYPEVVDRLVVSVCVPRNDRAALHRRRLWKRAAELHDPRFYGDLTIHSGFSRAFFERPDAEDLMNELLDAMEAASPDASAYLDGVESLQVEDVTTYAAKIQAPTLLIGGSEDQMTPLEPAGDGVGLRELVDIVPDARLRVVEGAGHYVCVEQPDVVADYIRAFLDS
jgi:pimeloyl-ACP methyl ester carboxylesterase